MTTSLGQLCKFTEFEYESANDKHSTLIPHVL